MVENDKVEKVAVIMPVFNGEHFLQRSLGSIFAQTRQPDEVLVVDDGSTDATLSICEKFVQESGGRMKVLRQSKGGPARARNLALGNARSEFVAFLDADDWWEPRKLERQLSAMHAAPEAVASYTAMRMVNEVTGEVSVRHAFPPAKLRRALRTQNPYVAPSAVMARRVALLAGGGSMKGRSAVRIGHCGATLRALGRLWRYGKH